MKKVLAFLVALGLLFGSGAALTVSAEGSDDFFSLPPVTYPVPR